MSKEKINVFNRQIIGIRNLSFQDAFNLHQITAANIHIIADDGEEILPLSQQQTHLASLIVFISFLYIDGCKMVVLDQSFQDLFFGGIVTILSMLKTYYPNMQFIVI
ncbi:uncharacterized protein LOC128721558 [Anopheles nili]|uniref:uncharacterized protein LOC128721558 n=1 Tax=Anopheles nili TaxID=185578 RepID=UPI00237AB46C|nr:uncharacterized protein LOC128721558 [Anopheles nili]